VVLVAGDRNKIDPAYLSVLKADALVLAGVIERKIGELVSPKGILLDVTGKPEKVVPGEKTAITVTVRTADGGFLANAKVSITAGGGKFLPKADTPFDPKGRLHSPYSATGTTDDKGQFTTWWVCNPAASGYVLNIEVSSEGYINGKSNYTIHVGQ
jgi:hypothetical protein